MVVYKSREFFFLMLLQTYWDLDFKAPSKSFQFINIRIWLTQLLEKQVHVSWYFWRPILTAVKKKLKG